MINIYYTFVRSLHNNISFYVSLFLQYLTLIYLFDEKINFMFI